MVVQTGHGQRLNTLVVRLNDNSTIVGNNRLAIILPIKLSEKRSMIPTEGFTNAVAIDRTKKSIAVCKGVALRKGKLNAPGNLNI